VTPDLASEEPTLRDETGRPIAAAIRPALREAGAPRQPDDQHELLFVAEMQAGQTRTYSLLKNPAPGAQSNGATGNVKADAGELRNAVLRLTFDRHGHPTTLKTEGVTLAGSPLMRTAVSYGRGRYEVGQWHVADAEVLGGGTLGILTMTGEIPIPTTDRPIIVTREYAVAADLPYLYVTTDIVYPTTPPHTRRPDVVRRLEREFDDRWKEVMPCEIRPGLSDREGRPLRIWKHNYLDHVSAYELNYAQISGNTEVDASNNQITHGWDALSDREQGVLIAQSADAGTCFAFCPMRTRITQGHTQAIVNPFGTYFGHQMRYPTAQTGLGKRVAILMAETLRSPAPSYSGRHERFSLMLAPYRGDAPAATIQADAEAFAYPYAVLSASPAILPPAHRTWSPDFDTLVHGQSL